jgi:hypothetical protein
MGTCACTCGLSCIDPHNRIGIGNRGAKRWRKGEGKAKGGTLSTSAPPLGKKREGREGGREECLVLRHGVARS